MVMKNYPPQFKADAVALYESRPEATIRSVAADLGINPETLRNWVRAAGVSRPRGRRTQEPSQPPAPLEAENAALRKKVRELEEEREILRKAAKYFAGGDALVNRFQCVADLQRRYGVKRLCSILGVSRSSFYYWRRTAADRAARQVADAKLAARIRAVHQESDGTYGAPRITAELREENSEAVNHKRVARIMRASGIEGVRLRRRHRTTVSDPAAAKAPDLIGRDFTATAPNTKYVGDITYLPIEGGKFCYLATVIDLASRRLAGWAIADHMRADLVTDALAAAIRTRGSLAGSIMHTDHGAQYTSRIFAEACRSAGVRQSMSAVGSSADNALAESFNATFKRETLQGRKSWPTEREARLDAFRWLHRYNTRRRHSRLGQRSPIAFENALHRTPTTLAQAA
ncbi:IS3 family transposase [Streptomyces koyangensis]|uniref:IS3 family transposase n=4 Tax=Streptomyces TaxID=1883 RepID=A0A385D965_9ACTN|nr:IS3 family transposase [Streptomyces koyangensis]WTD01300.1 IS3 family transposase [Streptomyces albidoflavus]AXQ54933.1 IS3 family transposase [Streptomyces koyangensis]AXQ58738.1 IS3 family transposase [Streptomyces koyangensis]WTD01365.1 IS3 family transposase [Streptomyces albidoflavus]WTD02266.1 IS3 family transposase [Streptomyces albidoflavus]